MTREEALKILDTIPTIGEQVDALEMAIKALEQEPSGDLISREETLTAFADYVGSGMSMDDYDALWNIVTKMPSVKQEPKTKVLDKIRAEIEMYEADCILADDSKECKECDKIVFGSIYRIIDKYREGQE